MNTFIDFSATHRGFKLGEFTDFYGKKCSIQKSSLATDDAIWLGVDNPEPQILHGDARRLGIPTNATSGWVDYPIPDEVKINTRMHLTRRQVWRLLPTLIKFVFTGNI
jgi:hypothetical protein